MRVLVTGSAGFIGKALCRELLKRNHHVIGLDVRQTLITHRNLLRTRCDFTQTFDISYWDDVDYCFHLGAMANLDEVREQQEKAFEINIYGTYKIIEACKVHNIPLAFASTACVYGHVPPHNPSTEDGPTIPVDLYGVTKRAGEELIKGLLKRWVILRFGTTLGPTMRPALATWIFLQQAMKKQPFTIRGNGNQTRNWIYVDDLVDGCIKIMDSGTHNEIFNLSGTQTWSVNEMAQFCNEIVNGKDSIFRAKYGPPRPDDVMYENIDITKIKSMIGWQPKTDLRTALKLIYDEWKRTGKIRELM